MTDCTKTANNITTTITSPTSQIYATNTGELYSLSPNGCAIKITAINTSSIAASTVVLSKNTGTIRIELDDDTYEDIQRDELVKYICERTLREENEVVRALWDRYSVAVKLVRSNDNGSNGS